jgi:lipopolysaccharide assembly outer membrane protein LptD (OstA)
VIRASAAALLSIVLLAAAFEGVAEAQQSLPGIDNIVADRSEQVGTDVESHYRFIGNVEMTLGDAMLYADLVEVYIEKDLMVATGNVTLVQTTNRISADRAEFNYKTKLGTFWDAVGFATIKPPAPRPGAFAPPPVSSQDTDVYFTGEVVEKIGGRKYKITKGGFTTCVQPTPRWQLTSDTIVLNIEHYTFLRNAIFSVKGVPFLYTPVMYYPTKKDDRATGFLIPTFGQTTVRGESIHNAFFWAIDRSEDLTFMHDWFTKTGQGVGSEYRYNFGGASNGDLKAYLLDQHEATYAQPDGSVIPVPGSTSYEIHGNATQFFPFGIRARGRVDYFSSIVENQSFNMNYLNAYASQRSYGGNAIGAWGTYSMNATLDHTQWFSSATQSTTTGSWPTISFTRNERLIPDTPLYFSAGAQYASLERNGQDTDHPELDYNQDVTRLDFSPQIRFPFTKWQWFTVNSTVAWRDTFYTRSLETDPETNAVATVDKSLNRKFFTMQSQIVGPVFNRVWDTPDNQYAEKFKHTVEPFLTIVRTTAIDNFDKIILIDGTDYIVGGNTQLTYGVNNRFYAKRPSAPGQRSQPREILDVSISQSHYSQAQASQYDIQYTTSSNTIAASNFSPILITVRAMPTDQFNAQSSIEIDSRYLALRQVSAGGGYSWGGRVQTNFNWSKRAFIAQLDGFNDPATLNQAISGQTNVHTRDNHFGSIYSFNYDVLQGTMLNQRVSGFYNSQCCGIAFEYQTFNYAGITQGLGVSADHRFFLSFTLAGLGNFSPFNGAMSGVPH